jgi:hypothetical protein
MGAIEGFHSGDLKAGMAQMYDAGAPVFMWCLFMENGRNADNYVPRRGADLCPYALAHSHVEFKPNALTQRCKRAGCLAYCHISDEVRTKMSLRGTAAILCCEAAFDGYAGYWFLSIEKAVLFVCDSFTVVETEMPLRDPRVWESFGIVHGDSEATFKTQIVAGRLGGYTNKHAKPLKLDFELPASLSEKFGISATDEILSPEREKERASTGWRNRNKATGLTKPDASGQPIFATKPPPMPRLPPLNFSGPNVQPEEEEMKHDTDEEQWEVDRFYAPKGKDWQLMRGDQVVTVEQFAATADGKEMEESDYLLSLQASFVGYSGPKQKTRYPVPYESIPAGKKLDDWNARYWKPAEKLLLERLVKDRKAFRQFKSARAHFAKLLPLVLSAKENEELVSKTVGELVRDGEASEERAYRAWSTQHLQDVKADERKECDFEVTGVALSGVCGRKPGVAAPQ